jgi:hypothetical protein
MKWNAHMMGVMWNTHDGDDWSIFCRYTNMCEIVSDDIWERCATVSKCFIIVDRFFSFGEGD